jgi:hypothetical protein
MQHIVLISGGSSIPTLRMADMSALSRFISHILEALTTFFFGLTKCLRVLAFVLYEPRSTCFADCGILIVRNSLLFNREVGNFVSRIISYYYSI